MNLLNILANKKNIIYLVLITILYIILFCQNLDSYHFLDFFETKYTTIAKEMLINNTLLNQTLNGEKIFSIQPLFFWIINFFCFVFGKITLTIVRFPNILCLFGTIIFMYFTLKKIIDERHAFITSLTFITNIAIIFYAHFAMIDTLFIALGISAILCALRNILNEEENKKYFILMYILVGLSGLASSLIGFISIFLIIIFLYLISQKGKQLIKPTNLVIGLFILSITIMPWNAYIVYTHGQEAINGLINLPKYKYFLTNVLTLFFILFPYFLLYKKSSIIVKLNFVKSFLLKIINPNFKKLKEIQWNNCRLKNQFLIANTLILIMGIFLGLIFNKTYIILLLILPISCITSHYIDNFLKQRFETKNVFKIISIICIIPILTSIFLMFSNSNAFGIQKEIKETFFMPIVIISYIIPIFVLLFCILKNKIMLIITYLLTMIYLSGIITPYLYNFISLTTGENDLIKFATNAKTKNIKLMVFLSKQKYIIPYYYDNNVEFRSNKDYEYLRNYMQTNKDANVIIKIKDLNSIEKNNINYNLVDSGKKYCLIEYNEENIQQEEVEIITY